MSTGRDDDHGPITNIDSDGSVPASPEPYWNKYNVYRARVAADDPGVSDLTVGITDVCVADCDYGPVLLAYQVANRGGVDAAAGAVVNSYAVDGSTPRLVASEVLPAIASGASLDGVTLTLHPGDVGTDGFRATVDDADSIAECDETNNSDNWWEATCP